MMTTNQPNPTKAQDLLHRAADLMDERGKQYDQRSGERSMQSTVTAFNAISGYSLTEADGFLLMALLKMVRDQKRETPHRDSIEDLVSYASLYGEARLRGEAQSQKLMQDEAKACEALAHMESGLKAHKLAQEARDQMRQKLALASQVEQELALARKAHQAAQEARYAGR